MRFAAKSYLWMALIVSVGWLGAALYAGLSGPLGVLFAIVMIIWNIVALVPYATSKPEGIPLSGGVKSSITSE